MGNLLYIVAVVLVILWAVGHFGFHAGSVIHVLLLIALIAVLLRVIRGDKVI
ncbi:MAG: lmo0937 family membrane protein [Bacteroidetes bacterium]|nr:lmo0937 family membrane protein [Bacteroidota bacterium]